MTSTSSPVRASARIEAAGITDRTTGGTARDVDRRLQSLTRPSTLDTTHFDTVRFPPPPWAEGRFATAARDGAMAYTPYRGSDDVRTSLAEPLTQWLDLDVDPYNNILLTPGTQAGLFTTLSGLVDPGDKVALIDPDYLFSERILTFLGARISHTPLSRPTGEDDSRTPDLDALESSFRDGARMFVFSHPNNPTGTVYPRETLEGIATLATRYDVKVLVDELYGRLVYDDTPFVHLASLPGMRERTVTLLGPSKTESLSGYRLGVVVGPAAAIQAAEDMLSLTALRAPGYAQHVLKGWLTDDVEWVADRVQQLHRLRELTITHFRQLAWVRLTPERGTAYLFPDLGSLHLPDHVISEALVTQADVLISPGYQFGPSGVGHFRVCYARDEQVWEAALERVVEVLDGLHHGNARE